MSVPLFMVMYRERLAQHNIGGLDGGGPEFGIQ